MKKIFCAIIAFTMLFSTVYAEDTKAYENALQIVKARIGSTDEYNSFQEHTNTQDDQTSYTFNWRKEDVGELQVSITSGGVITNYHKYTNETSGKSSISERLTKDKAEAAAKKFLAQLNPDIIKDIRIDSCNAYNDGFRFEISRTYNGIKVSDNTGSISIDAKGTKIVDFSLTYTTDAKFETGTTIDKASALKAFNDKLGFELLYKSDNDNIYYNKIIYNDDKDITVYPVYKTKEQDNKYISAITGDVVTGEHKIIIYDAKSEMALNNSPKAYGSGLTEAEISELDHIATTVSVKDAIGIIKANNTVNLPAEAFKKYDINTFNIDKKTRGFSFSFNWDENNYAQVNLNAETGKIISFWKPSDVDEKKTSITKEQALETAKKAIADLSPDKVDSYKLKDSDSDYYFRFVRYVNNIPFYTDAISVSVNQNDNFVSQYSIDYHDIDFPSIEKAVSYEQASTEYISKAGYDLEYVLSDKAYKLVYALGETNSEVDALTGKYKNFTPETKIEYSDITGHYAENIIKSLSEYGIGFGSETLKPDDLITQKDFAALIKGVISWGGTVVIDDKFDYDQLYKNGLDDFIDKSEQKPDSNVSRIDAAKYVAKAMGFGAVGKLDIYKPMFNDIAASSGYASILCGMGIMNGDGNGNFNPNGVLTRAQALVIIYNYLNK